MGYKIIAQFHIDKPREIGKQKVKISKREMMMAKDELQERVLRKKIREIISESGREELTKKFRIYAKTVLGHANKIFNTANRTNKDFVKPNWKHNYQSVVALETILKSMKKIADKRWKLDK
ncbi:hypothetical protein HOE22_01430 [Candidatus Woesearchaeota archaeon]|nr:hypothetical protein [Candidatus Woesearchaeota archaeon]MBT4732662.1 hypothetical protein [Candidatus Woesearchaeota archaeon]MBT7558872.1 hypothetical protein [Candidatus Woesearchaeota archaeon]